MHIGGDATCRCISVHIGADDTYQCILVHIGGENTHQCISVHIGAGYDAGGDDARGAAGTNSEKSAPQYIYSIKSPWRALSRIRILHTYAVRHAAYVFHWRHTWADTVPCRGAAGTNSRCRF